MVAKTVLLTSFTTWESHHISNSSDDLLLEILKTHPPTSFHFLRQLPVDFELAPQQAIAKFQELQPDLIICCGMAEHRTQLSVESQAVLDEKILTTPIDIAALIAGLTCTEISHDAGRFVCNRLYYDLLDHVLEHDPQRGCLFVHVPVLTDHNREAIATDFQIILQRLTVTDLVSHC